MSTMKNGLTTLNRWLGKKNKEKSALNGNLSKSNANLNLSISTANINETSQLEYNRITPLPVVTSNAPFEQTFRITVLLPKDQLYVARLGARVPLSKLMELVCENKLLDADKYEFRNPVDPSQVYSCELTIGSVGLSEVRLCHKSEPYADTFNADEVIKLHRTSIIRDSLSSSEFSSRNSKLTTKTPSPYSSSNSLNSMDSTGMNYTRTPITMPHPTQSQAHNASKLIAPPRKKRAAPRPPSQIVIPEKSALVITNGNVATPPPATAAATEEPIYSLPQRKNHHMSTPNLASEPLMNGGGARGVGEGANKTTPNCNGGQPPSPVKIRPEPETSDPNPHAQANGDEVDAAVQQRNVRNLRGQSVQNLSSFTAVDEAHALPEPSPRKRIVQVIKKKSAPAPPMRGGSIPSEDAVSIASTTPSTPDTPLTPRTPNEASTRMVIPSPELAKRSADRGADMPTPKTRETLANSSPPLANVGSLESNDLSPVEKVKPQPKPVPRVTTTTAIVNASGPLPGKSVSNVSKVLLNRTPTPEPRSLSTEPETEADRALEQINSLESNHSLELINGMLATSEDDDNVSKQADSGIGEPIPSPIPDSLPASESSAHECSKSTFESSSDDDVDMIKVYNFKEGKTIMRPIDSTEPEVREGVDTAASSSANEMTPTTLSETASWNFSIPISPPPNFADGDDSEKNLQSGDKAPDTPITPKIKERPVLNFDTITTTTTMETVQRSAKESSKDLSLDFERVKKTAPFPSCVTPLPSPCSPLNEIVDELNAIIHGNRIDSVIKKADNQSEIEAAKPNTLSNFSIASITQQSPKSAEIHSSASASSGASQATTDSAPAEDEKLYRKRGSITGSNTNLNAILKQRKSLNRADSFHATVKPSPTAGESLTSRSSSHLSLTKLEYGNGNGGPGMSRRRSSSELSIGESPSLQSPEVIRTILNSRKNSLANSISSGDEDSKALKAQVNGPNAQETPGVEMRPKINDEGPAEIEKPTEIEDEQTSPVKVVEETPKLYRYTGPPSINFATWNERPKAQVSIKNDCDYIFGGGKNATPAMSTVPRDYRHSSAVAFAEAIIRSEEPKSLKTPPVVAPKPSTTKRMGIEEKEYRVPITVRPLKDVTVEGAAVAETNNNEPLATHAKRPQVSQVYGMATLPRSGPTNRFSMPSSVASGPALLRSTSITKTGEKSSSRANEENVTKTTVPVTVTNPVPTSAPTSAPFGQNTLRKTGLKERMLAKEQAAAAATDESPQKVQLKANVKAAETPAPVKVSHAFTNGDVKMRNFTLNSLKSPAARPQSAKFEFKLQATTTMSTPPSATATSSTATIRRPTTPQSAPAAPPPPPTMPKIHGGVAKSKSQPGSAATTPNSGGEDPRNQLLEAIRNFKRDELKAKH